MMKHLLFLALLSFPLGIFGQTFDVTSKNGTVNFTYDSSTKGTLSGVSATIKFDVSNLAKGSIFGTANVSTLSTGNSMRDKHLKSKDYFDAATYPTMKFSSTSITQSGDKFTVKGNLKIKNTEKEVTFTAVNKDGKIILTATIYGSDFGVSISKKRDKTKITISVEIPM
jgi:polyisoprenoid-binding protein YceI